MPARLLAAVILAGLAGFALGCGDPSAPPARSADGARRGTASSPAERPGPPRPITSLKRAQVKQAVADGVGAFLQNVTFEDMPVIHNGKFHGFVIHSINSEWGVDLKPGDVVTRVNGIVVEQPDDADAALRSLEKAAALKVEFEREGKPRTLELPIVD